MRKQARLAEYRDIEHTEPPTKSPICPAERSCDPSDVDPLSACFRRGTRALEEEEQLRQIAVVEAAEAAARKEVMFHCAFGFDKSIVSRKKSNYSQSTGRAHCVA